VEAIQQLWAALDAGASALSLAMIVALALGLVALAVLYAASALWVLERFARASERPVPLLAACAAVAALLAAVGLRSFRPELDLAPWSVWGAAWVRGFAVLAAATAALAFPVRALLRRLPAGPLGVGTAAVLGASLALLLASSGRAAAPAVPALAFGAAALGLRFRRRRRGRPATPLETALVALVVCLGLGSALAAALGGPREEVAMAGLGLGGVWLGLVLLGLLPLAVAGLLDLRRSAEWFVARRYLVARRREVLISLITGVCIAGVAAGVWLIITVLSVLNGVEATWREQIVGNHAHFVVRSALGSIRDYEAALAAVRDSEGVVAATPTLEAEGMIRVGRRVAGVRLRGLDPASAPEVTRVGETLLEGRLADLAREPSEESGLAGYVLLGSALAEEVGAAVGDTVLLLSPHGGAPSPLGPSPRLLRYEVVGRFRSQFLQYDQLYAYTSLAGAQHFLRLPDVAGALEVRSRDLFRSRPIALAVEARLGSPYYARDWKQLYPHLFRAVQDNRSMLMLLMVMIMAVGAFTIVATLLLMVLEKAGDIGILKAMGAEDAAIERIFAIEGALIGSAGVAAGVLAAVAVTQQLDWIQARVEQVTGVDTLPESVYQLSSLPARLDPLQLLAVAGVALGLALGATLLPARQGASIDPVSALRGE